jgi:hypothetical protein
MGEVCADQVDIDGAFTAPGAAYHRTLKARPTVASTAVTSRLPLKKLPTRRRRAPSV